MKSPEKEQGTINITESQRRVLKFWNCKFSPSPTPASLHPAPQPRVPLSGSLRWSLESSNLCFNQPSRWFWCVLTLLAEYQLYTGMFKYVLSWTEWITVQRTSALEPSLTLRSLSSTFREEEGSKDHWAELMFSLKPYDDPLLHISVLPASSPFWETELESIFVEYLQHKQFLQITEDFEFLCSILWQLCLPHDHRYLFLSCSRHFSFIF